MHPGLLLTTALLVPVAFPPAPSRVAIHAEEAAPPDLRLEWLVRDAAAREDAEPLRGRPGETLTVSYRLRNVGGSDAFAAVLDARTALGRAAAPERLQPGPDAGATADRMLRLAIAEGMRELCIDARLQTRDAEDPDDPNRNDNRICRKVVVEQDGDTERRNP